MDESYNDNSMYLILYLVIILILIVSIIYFSNSTCKYIEQNSKTL